MFWMAIKCFWIEIEMNCQGNPPVTGGLPSKRPVTRSLDGFFDLCLNKRLSKQSRRRWFAALSRSLWHHCNAQTGPINSHKHLMSVSYQTSFICAWPFERFKLGHAEKHCQFDNFVVINDTVSCHNDNWLCQQWRQGCQFDYILFPMMGWNWIHLIMLMVTQIQRHSILHNVYNVQANGCVWKLCP